MKAMFFRSGFAVCCSLLVSTGCVLEEETPHFWRFTRSGQEAVMYFAGGHADMVSPGHVYEYEPGLDEYESSVEDRPGDKYLTPTGYWREIAVPEIPKIDSKCPYKHGCLYPATE